MVRQFSAPRSYMMLVMLSPGQLEVMRLLYRAGADLELTNSEEKTATFIAAEHGQVRVHGVQLGGL